MSYSGANRGSYTRYLLDDPTHAILTPLNAATDSGVNLAHRHRIRQEGVSLMARAWHRALRGVEDDGYVSGTWVAAKTAADLEAVHVGQIHVEQDGVYMARARGLDTLCSSKYVPSLEAREAEQFGQSLGMGFVVVNDKNLEHDLRRSFFH